MPTIPANNNTGLYNSTGNVVPTDGNITTNNINASGNVTVGGFIYASGSITTDANFVGDLVGNVTGNIVLGGGNTEVIYNNSGVTGSDPNFTFNSATDVLDVNGNIQANYFIGDGSQLTGLPAGYSDANVVTLMANFGSNTIVTTGNISGGYILGNGSQLTGIPAQYGNANVAAFLPTYTGNLGANIITATGNITGLNLKTSGAGGNITGAEYVVADFFVGDGSLLTNVTSSFGNANVGAYLTTYTGNIAAGNITVAEDVVVAGDVTAGVFYGTFAGNISGNLTVPGSNTWVLYNNAGNAGADSNFTFNSATNTMTVTGTANLTTINATTVSASGNITGGNIAGSGAELSNLTGANVTGTVANAAYATAAGTATSATTAGTANTVTDAAQANITSVGTLTSLSVTGNITGGNISGAGAGLSNLTGANVTGTVANAAYATAAGSAATATTANTVIDGAQANITSVGTLTSLAVSGNVTATGNVTGDYFLGNGSQLTGIVSSYGNTEVAAFLPTYTGAMPAMTGAVTTTGNISGAYLLGNGSAISSVTGANVTGTVANAAYATAAGSATTATSAVTANTVTDAAQANITSVGTLTGLTVSGNTATANLSATGTVDIGTGAAPGTLILNDNTRARFYNNNNNNYVDIVYGGTSSVNHTLLLPTTVGANGQVLTAANANASSTELTWATSSFTGPLTGNLDAAGFNISNVGNITTVNLTATDQVYASNITGAAGQNVTITASDTGDIHLDADSIRIGDNNQPATIVTHGTGDLILRTHEGSLVEGSITIFDGANGNIALAPNGTGIVTVSSNIATANLAATGTSTLGQFQFIGNTLTSTQAFDVTTTPTPGRLLIGNGASGVFPAEQNSNRVRLRLLDQWTVVDDGLRRGEMAVGAIYDFNGGNIGVANTNTRFGTFISSTVYQNGTQSQNQYLIPVGFRNTNTLGSGANTGNVTMSVVTTMQNNVSINAGSTANTAVGFNIQGSFTGKANTVIGFSSNFTSTTSGSTPDNAFVYYNGNSTGRAGLLNNNNFRAAGQYYCLFNEDDAAQMRLGSLRLYHQFRYTQAIAAGVLAINKANAQVQYVDVTEDITSVTFSNFVRTASDGTNTDQQTDTVTVILRQDATGRTVTMPTGAGYRYAGGVSTVGNTAASVTQLTVTGITDAAGTGIEYLITVSPEFT